MLQLQRELQIKKEVFIACPVCFSGNSYYLDQAGRELACEDCGFLLAAPPKFPVSDLAECIFCGGGYFYFEAPLDLSFLGRASICYVCEARYKGIVIDDPEEKYSQEGARNAQLSEAASYWKERVEQYNCQVSE